MRVTGRWLGCVIPASTYESQESAKDALKWATYTYVIAALSSFGYLIILYYDLFGKKRLRLQYFFEEDFQK